MMRGKELGKQLGEHVRRLSMFQNVKRGGLPSIEPIPSIIAANVVVFGAWQYSQMHHSTKFMAENFTLSLRGVLKDHRWHTLFTSFFSHFDFMHILTNMFVLWSFGTNVFNIVGRSKFLWLYMGGGLASSVCTLAWPFVVPRSWPAANDSHRFAFFGLGASGAVNAVVMYNVFSFPRSMVYLFGVVPVPAALFGLGYVAMDARELFTGGSHTGNAAHLGGAAFGALMFFWHRFRRLR